MKPKHEAGYGAEHTDLCERALVTLLRGLGPWKGGICLVGGLVPRYLIPPGPGDDAPFPHVGTTDVDVVLDFQFLTEVHAYRTLVENLKSLGFERGANEAGNPQHHSWRYRVEEGISVVIDLLCDVPEEGGRRVAQVPGETALSAIRVPGAHLALEDYRVVAITAELLGARGVATEDVNVTNIVPFLILKSLAYDDRMEEKDAYDIVYCLSYYGDRGPADVAQEFRQALARWPEEPLLSQCVDVLRSRFATDEQTPGYRKDGPRSYARFRTRVANPTLNVQRQRDAAAVVEEFLRLVAGGEAPD